MRIIFIGFFILCQDSWDPAPSRNPADAYLYNNDSQKNKWITHSSQRWETRLIAEDIVGETIDQLNEYRQTTGGGGKGRKRRRRRRRGSSVTFLMGEHLKRATPFPWSPPPHEINHPLHKHTSVWLLFSLHFTLGFVLFIIIIYIFPSFPLVFFFLFTPSLYRVAGQRGLEGVGLTATRRGKKRERARVIRLLTLFFFSFIIRFPWCCFIFFIYFFVFGFNPNRSAWMPQRRRRRRRRREERRRRHLLIHFGVTDQTSADPQSHFIAIVARPQHRYFQYRCIFWSIDYHFCFLFCFAKFLLPDWRGEL